MKKLLFILCLFSITANAEEIKLSCKVSSITNKPNNKLLNQSGLAIIEIDASPPRKIHIYSDILDLDNISTSEPLQKWDTDSWSLSGKDESTENKYRVISEYCDKKRQYCNYDTIQLDRNTGDLIFHRTNTDNKRKITSFIDASGTCTKVDTTKRKF
jgi:hypothetical protein